MDDRADTFVVLGCLGAAAIVILASLLAAAYQELSPGLLGVALGLQAAALVVMVWRHHPTGRQ